MKKLISLLHSISTVASFLAITFFAGKIVPYGFVMLFTLGRPDVNKESIIAQIQNFGGINIQHSLYLMITTLAVTGILDKLRKQPSMD